MNLGNPRVLRWALVAVVATIVAVAVLRERFFMVVTAGLVWGVVITSVARGEVFFGRANARVIVRRADTPVRFWAIMAFLVVFAVLTSVAVFHGKVRSKTRISDWMTEPTPAGSVSSSSG